MVQQYHVNKEVSTQKVITRATRKISPKIMAEMESIEKLKHFFNDLKDKFDPHPKGKNELINLDLITKQKKTLSNKNL